MAGALGQWADGDPEANHAVTAYTEGADPGSGRTQLESVLSVNVGAKRFLTFSVDVAETNCFANHTKLGFYLLDAVTAYRPSPLRSSRAPTRGRRSARWRSAPTPATGPCCSAEARCGSGW
ncbi:hypothetical protein [Microbispora sp. GKU 823]|uniref:hypothetical protein n=1 Tax=Microbispora sp. GKU 823 TaxID=1652100 RepID=UPI00117DF83B|nr:hypothetical protein [Microbispora sp. GKU 823]